MSMEAPEGCRPSHPRVGLLYDERMCRHTTPDGEPHPECPDRVRAIWRALESAGIPEMCVVMNAKEADERHIARVHTRKHIGLVKEIGGRGYDPRKRYRAASRFNSIYLNEASSESAFLAAGSVVEVAEKVASGELDSAIAIVRPPGHHAEPDEMMGFCIFNNVAIAASYLLNKGLELGIKKILIVDWDVHHGNGTQKMFWNDPRVLFFSVHRFDFGCFYPTGDDGSHTKIGGGLGAGYNINVPWEHGRCGDADYLAAWDHILIPVAEAYNPDIILISGGFDAAINDPLGGCHISPYGYSIMLSKLMSFAHGKIVIALEGGYNLNSIAKSVLACAVTLIKQKPIIGSIEDQPFSSTLRVLQKVRRELSPYWPVLAVELAQNVLTNTRNVPPIELLVSSSSDSDTEDTQGPSISEEFTGSVSETNVADIVLPLSTLSIHEHVDEKKSMSNHSSTIGTHSLSLDGLILPDPTINRSDSWRLPLSKIDIWYGSYGSNMWTPRFLCYIRGGKVDGMSDPCPGSKDKSPPKGIFWRTMPHRLFFGRSHSKTWGAGGVAFVHPEFNSSDNVHMCLYKITLEQFNDVLLQENAATEVLSPLFDLSALQDVAESKSLLLSSLMGGWYSNVLYLGKEDNVPILTMTCSIADIEGFRSSNLPMLPPSKDYMNTLLRGLVEGKQLSEKAAIDYIHGACL